MKNITPAIIVRSQLIIHFQALRILIFNEGVGGGAGQIKIALMSNLYIAQGPWLHIEVVVVKQVGLNTNKWLEMKLSGPFSGMILSCTHQQSSILNCNSIFYILGSIKIRINLKNKNQKLYNITGLIFFFLIPPFCKYIQFCRI